MFANDYEYATVAYISALDVTRTKRKGMGKQRLRDCPGISFDCSYRHWLKFMLSNNKGNNINRIIIHIVYKKRPSSVQKEGLKTMKK